MLAGLSVIDGDGLVFMVLMLLKAYLLSRSFLLSYVGGFS